MNKIERMRIFVIATPRSGNTWLSHLLGTLYQIPRSSTHDLTPELIAGLPDEFVHQIHLQPTAEALKTVADLGAKVVTISRHPLDVLLSVLQFAVHNHETRMWLAGAGGDERLLWAATPTSRGFREYVLGHRASELLSVTPNWTAIDGVMRVKYERLVEDTPTALGELAACIAPPRQDVMRAVEACTIPELKRSVGAPHFWHGRPGLWQQLLAAPLPAEVAAHHPTAFEPLGYGCESIALPDVPTANRNWVGLIGEAMSERLLRIADSVHDEFTRLGACLKMGN